MPDRVNYRVALIQPLTRRLLLLQRDGALALPVIDVPSLQRPAYHLTRSADAMWNMKTVMLESVGGNASLAPCAILEIRGDSLSWESDGFKAWNLETVPSTLLEDELRSVFASILQSTPGSGSTWARIGWVDEAQKWIQQSVGDRPIHFTEEVTQLNGGGGFCLARFGTDKGPAYWLKAIAEPNTQEFDITSFLATNCPTYLPRVVCMRKDWNAWVMEEAGSSLHDSTSLLNFERAAASLADLQLQLIGRSRDLLGAGCTDHRIEMIETQIDEMIAYLEEAMSMQTSTKVCQLSGSRLRELGWRLHQSCSELMGLGIPDSLMHNDISPGSIVSDGTNCVFIDWCEGAVGNPFLSFEQLCVHTARKTDAPDLWLGRLRRVYKRLWSPVLADEQIDRALQLVPLIAVLSYLCGRGDWLRSQRRYEASFLSYSRSLARHMDRIARSSEASGSI